MSTTALHRAADNCDVAEVRALVASNPRMVHERDSEGNTPLRLTVSIEVARILLGAGADVNTANEDGLTPLHKAAFCYNGGLVPLYLDQKANVHAQNRKGITPLISAAMAGNEYQMSLLLVSGADPCHLDHRGVSAINENQAMLMRDMCLLLGALQQAAAKATGNDTRAAAAALHTAMLTVLFNKMVQPVTPPGDVVLSPSGRGVLEAWKQDVSEKCRNLRALVPYFAQRFAGGGNASGVPFTPRDWQVVEEFQRALEEQHRVKGTPPAPPEPADRHARPEPEPPPPEPGPEAPAPATLSEPAQAVEPTVKTHEFACPSCQGKLRARNTLWGKRIRCPRCKAGVTIPNPDANRPDDDAVPAPAHQAEVHQLGRAYLKGFVDQDTAVLRSLLARFAADRLLGLEVTDEAMVLFKNDPERWPLSPKGMAMMSQHWQAHYAEVVQLRGGRERASTTPTLRGGGKRQPGW